MFVVLARLVHCPACNDARRRCCLSREKSGSCVLPPVDLDGFAARLRRRHVDEHDIDPLRMRVFEPAQWTLRATYLGRINLKPPHGIYSALASTVLERGGSSSRRQKYAPPTAKRGQPF